MKLESIVNVAGSTIDTVSIHAKNWIAAMAISVATLYGCPVVAETARQNVSQDTSVASIIAQDDADSREDSLAESETISGGTSRSGSQLGSGFSLEFLSGVLFDRSDASQIDPMLGLSIQYLTSRGIILRGALTFGVYDLATTVSETQEALANGTRVIWTYATPTEVISTSFLGGYAIPIGSAGFALKLGAGMNAVFLPTNLDIYSADITGECESTSRYDVDTETNVLLGGAFFVGARFPLNMSGTRIFGYVGGQYNFSVVLDSGDVRLNEVLFSLGIGYSGQANDRDGE
jgi:hypothetical protein